jgi:hypothetical protein
MKKFLIKKSILIGGGVGIFFGFLLFLFFDVFYGSNFRSMQDSIWPTLNIDLRGLRELRASGGTSLRFSDFQRLHHIKGPKTVVDGMAEFHGYIDHGIPTTVLGYQREGSPSLKHLMRRWILTGTGDVRSDLVISEAEEAKKHGFDYKKVNIGSKFMVVDADIDKILAFFKSLPKNIWLHFHCAHGKGRTSLLLVMLDIFKNAPEVGLQDIVKRQYLLGSEDLFNTEVWKNGTYDKKTLEDRKKFVEDFYDFMCQWKAGGMAQWSDWHRQQKKEILR